MSAAVQPAVGVVVLTWNATDDTVACLDSLWRADPRPARVVLVDNASADDSVARIAAHAREHGIPVATLRGAHGAEDACTDALPWLTIVTLREHRGFSGGNNVGLRLLARDGDLTHFLLLNNDTEVEADYFARLAEALRQAPEAALLSGTIRHWHDRARVWWAGGRVVPWRALALHEHHVPADATPRPTEFITGCALVISRAALRRAGELPECYYPAYVEDAEYCFRARQLGVAVLYAPAPVVYHKIGATLRRAGQSSLQVYLDVRHRAWFVRRNLRGARRVTALAYLAATKPARALVELARGRPRLAAAVLRGVLHGFFGRGAWAERAPGTP